MRKRRLTLASALLLSLLLHLLVVGGGEISLPDIYSSPDEVLASRAPTHVQRVQLAARPPAPAPARNAAAGMRMVKVTQARLPRKRQQRAASPPASPASPASPARADITPVADLPAAPAPEAPPLAETPPAAPPGPAPREPAPAFPVQLAAELEARVNGLSATLHQTWNMEGFHYAIAVQGSKFGYRALISSEGLINPEGGLNPGRSSLSLGGKVKSFTEYANGTLRMGKPESPQDYPLPVVPQDFASIPFHLAVTFNGTPQTIFVSTGRRLYQTRFALVAEETLKLPVGTLRTLHISGERFDHELREMVPAFDIWLAPDYLNFPVKVSGHLSGGEPIDYRVKWLEVEGRLVLGQHGDAQVAIPEEAVPAWLLQQGLKNP